MTEGAERIYGFGPHRESWDGSWLLVLARTPESERPSRHVLRSRLSLAGLGSPAPGVWIGTHAERLGEVEQVLADAGLAGEAQVFRGTHADGELPVLVGQAWDLGSVGQLYDDFIVTFSAAGARRPAGEHDRARTCLAALPVDRSRPAPSAAPGALAPAGGRRPFPSAPRAVGRCRHAGVA